MQISVHYLAVEVDTVTDHQEEVYPNQAFKIAFYLLTFRPIDSQSFYKKGFSLDILGIFRLDMGQIGSNIPKKAFATWQHGFLTTSNLLWQRANAKNMSAFESLYGSKFTLSTQLIKPNLANYTNMLVWGNFYFYIYFHNIKFWGH